MRYKKLLFLTGTMLCLSFTAVCQTTKDIHEGHDRENRQESKKVFTIKRSSRSKKKSAIDKDFDQHMKDNAIAQKKNRYDPNADFQKRMKKVGRENVKEERIMKKPQYSDPSYFGHKRKPKIRPVGKKKVCKECGLKH